jgi:hypothetical protein
MRLPAALLVLWVALIGAVAPALACSKPQSAMDCCPPDAPTDCRIAWSFERADETTAVTRALFNESIGVHSAHADDGGSPDSCGLPPAAFQFPSRLYLHSLRYGVPASEFLSNAALTYLRTGRLRL